MSTFKSFVSLAAVVFFVVPSFAQEQSRGIERIDGPEAPLTSEFKYRKKWLVVVGINYDRGVPAGSDTAEPVEDPQVTNMKKLPELKNAESDAMDVHQLLVEKFGFEQEEKSLIIGNDAKCETIRSKIGELENSETVTDEDCVLVYFSGHGMLLKKAADNSEVGYLLPDDVELQSGDKVHTGKAIEMNFVVESLLNCPARHKFLILDCCHSGAVFRLNDFKLDPDRESNVKELDLDEFKAKGFQVITASRDNQKASDGRNGHSPFTSAFLSALKTTPLSVEQTNGHRVFTANQVFEKMTTYLRGNGISRQQRGRIGEDLGQFHFIPDTAADFREGVNDEEQRKKILAMTPTTFGNWWALEVPWFMPGLRLAILQQNIPSRSMTDELDPATLLEAARQARSQSLSSGTGSTAVFEMRYRHLEKLLNAKNSKSQREAMQEIVAELEQHCRNKTPMQIPVDGSQKASPENDNASQRIELGAEDFHYLGVLHQLLEDSEKAETHYTRALEMYQLADQREPKGPSRSLQALCQLDAGILSTGRGDFAKAKERIRMARDQFSDKAPWPFRVFALCREADVYRREGRFQLSQARMEQAVDLLTVFDSEESALLSANTMKARAWAFMEGWEFKKAATDFEKAKTILTKFNESRFESNVDQLHVKHGLAMIERFQGRGPEALNKYRNLTLEIANHLTDLENNDDKEQLNYSEVRSLLFGRLVNSLERQADCTLFGEVPDYAEAADDYRRAIHECRNMGEEKRYTQLIDLLYRRAIAICLNAANQNSSDGIQRASIQEFALAKWICAEAEELLQVGSDAKLIIELPFKTKTVQKLACACLRLRPDSSEPEIVPTVGLTSGIGPRLPSDATEPKSCFQSLLSELTRDPSACDRDELERLMFFHKVLIDYRDRFQIEPYESLKHVGQLLAYCRSACRLKEPDPQLLAYLRPYYDSAFIAHSELLPEHTKELVEISFESTHGTPYAKPGGIQPLLAMYIARGKCYLLVDAPGSVSQTFMINEIASAEDFIAASDAAVPEFPLPDAVRQILREVEKRPDQESVELRWRDPVLLIGVERKSPAESGLVVTFRPNLDAPSLPDQAEGESTFKFPFNLPGTIHLKYAEDRNHLCVKATATNIENPGSISTSLQPVP